MLVGTEVMVVVHSWIGFQRRTGCVQNLQK